MASVAGGIKAGTKVGGAIAIAFMFIFDDMYALGIHAVAWFYACEINSLYVPLPPPNLPTCMVKFPFAEMADVQEIKVLHLQ